jgi:hypothetical protein
MVKFEVLKKILFIKIFFFLANIAYGNECKKKSLLKVGLINNSYIDYKPYLYYTLGNYSLTESVEFEINEVNKNAYKFDIIFGEYNELAKLSKNNFIKPKKIKKFYEINNISISGNILPLDLDTFIILSKGKTNKIDFEFLSNIQNSTKYTLGMSFLNNQKLLNLMTYVTENEFIDMNNIVIEKDINLFKKFFRNMNNNLLFANLDDVFDSYQNSDNIFTLFSDGILIHKQFNNDLFQLFPKSKYIWDSENGLYKKNSEINPISFFGFSAYLNDTSQSGFLCYLIRKDIRLKSFQNFDIELSPLSYEEIKNSKIKISDEYKDILEVKHKYIYENQNKDNDSQKIKNIIFGKNSYLDFIDSEGYLN